MRLVTVTTNHPKSITSRFITGMLCLTSSFAVAQYGVSPSQTGQFFDDLRARPAQGPGQGQGGSVRQGEGTYDYTDEGLADGSDGRTGSPSQDAARKVSQGYNSNASILYSGRSAGDYSQYQGPYPTSGEFFAPPYTSHPTLGGRRNIQLGGVNIGLGMSTIGEYNSNIGRSHDNPQSDYLAGAYLNISANYPLTERNSLTLSGAIGFDQYINNPELSSYGGAGTTLNVLPGTSLAFDGKIGPVLFVVYDRVSVRPAATNNFALANSQIFGVFENSIGMAAQWQVNSKLNVSMNYMHSDAVSLDDSANLPGTASGSLPGGIFDRSTDSIQSSIAWRPTGVWTLGMEGGLTWLRYPEQFNNNGTISTAGVFYTRPLGNNTWFRTAAGIQNMAFEKPPAFKRSMSDAEIADEATYARLSAKSDADLTVSEKAEITRIESSPNFETNQRTLAAENAQYDSNNRDTSDLSDFYFNAIITNRLNARISQSLSFGHESALNTTSNYITADYLSYGVGVIAWRGSRFSLSGYYEDAQESGGRLDEDIKQTGIDAYLSHQLTSKVRIGVGYHYGIVDSAGLLVGGKLDSSRDYVQQAYNIDLSYVMNSKLSVNLGYRHYFTTADDDQFSFEQDRIVMAAHYNF
jgi:hypothetical protein